MTTHQLAKDLLAMPDIPLYVEGWMRRKGYETQVKDYEGNDVSAAILVQRCVDPEILKADRECLQRSRAYTYLSSKSGTITPK